MVEFRVRFDVAHHSDNLAPFGGPTVHIQPDLLSHRSLIPQIPMRELLIYHDQQGSRGIVHGAERKSYRAAARFPPSGNNPDWTTKSKALLPALPGSSGCPLM